MFMENILEIKNLNIFFDKYQALYNVNLNLEKGILHALVGESGCGKTRNVYNATFTKSS